MLNIVTLELCMFCLKASVNKQSVRIWGVEPPDEHKSVVMSILGVMAWYCISKVRVIGPRVFEKESNTGEGYQNILIYYISPCFR